MRRREFTTGFASNGLVIVESLRSDERKTGKYLHDDLSAFCLAQKFDLQLLQISTAAEFRKIMELLTVAARKGFRPIVHLEIHGRDDRAGLVFDPSGDFMPWDE